MCIYSNNKCMCVFLISPVPIAEPLTSELIDTPVFHNLAPRPIKYRVSVPIPTHISLSLSLSLFTSAQFLFNARQRRAELNSVKQRYYVDCFSNFTCKYSQNHSTAIVIILWVFYLFRKRLDYQDFCAD